MLDRFLFLIVHVPLVTVDAHMLLPCWLFEIDDNWEEWPGPRWGCIILGRAALHNVAGHGGGRLPGEEAPVSWIEHSTNAADFSYVLGYHVKCSISPHDLGVGKVDSHLGYENTLFSRWSHLCAPPYPKMLFVQALLHSCLMFSPVEEKMPLAAGFGKLPSNFDEINIVG